MVFRILANVEALELTLQIIYWILVALVGLCIGSFLNVVIYRLPRKINLAKPRSFCPNCDHKLAWYDNIPVFAWLFLKGKCRYCGHKISPRYMIVELFTMFMWLVTYALFGQYNLPICILSFVVISCFIAIFFIDAEQYIIPDSLVIIIAVCGIIATAAQFNLVYKDLKVDWLERLIGLGIVVVFYFLVSLLEKILKKEIIGGGDLKLFAAISLFIGARLLLLGIFFGSVLALIVEIPFSKLLKRDTSEDGKSQILPFGPYLTIGFTIALFYGLPLISSYLSLFGI